MQKLKAQVIKEKGRKNALVEKCNQLVDEEKEANEKLKRMESKHEETCAQLMEGTGCTEEGIIKN